MYQHPAPKRPFGSLECYNESPSSNLHTKRQYHPGHAPQIVQRSDPHTISHLLNPEPESICYGMLGNVQIQFLKKQSIQAVKFAETGRNNEIFATLDLHISKGRCDILAAGVHVATMNSRTHSAITSLSSADSIRWTGILLQEQLQNNIIPPTKALSSVPSRLTCAMSLILHGPESIGDRLAQDLSRSHLFLQRPVQPSADAAYKNPQSLDMTLLGNPELLPPGLSHELLAEQDPILDLDDDVEMDLLDIVNNLPKQDNLQEAEVDMRIMTPLLSHQKEALDFIVCRESPEDTKLKRLWEIENTESGTILYRHVIDGSKSKEPEDMLGGILADGMGLGKTLTMLACVVATLPQANQFESGICADRLDSGPPLMRSSSTLVILPSILLLESWVDELEKHVVNGTLSYYKYHGPNRMLPSYSPPPYNLVFTTYGTVAADFRHGGGILRQFHWFRLILDEAHIVRNWSTKQFKAVADISASIRWCLTGTPIQNSLRDLSSLVTFLRLPILCEATNFRKYLERHRKTSQGTYQPDYANLKLLLGSICLRRCTSTILKSIGVEYYTRRPSLSKEERKGYDALSIRCSQQIKMAVNRKSSKSDGAALLRAVLLLRIFCNIGSASEALSKFDDYKLLPDEKLSLLQQSDEAICAICKSDVLSVNSMIARHDSPRGRLKCQACCGDPSLAISSGKDYEGTNDVSLTSIDNAGAVSMSEEDPSSNQMRDINTEFHDNSILQDMGSSHGLHHSSKLLSLLMDIEEHYLKGKSIVFSFWRRSLDHVERLFKTRGILHRRVDGNIHVSQRRKLLLEFQHNESVRVLLMTIGTGAIGLNNLSVANRIHILEPQWNPSVEDQAIGRVIRLGQNKKVSVIRYIMARTIEESIEDRQLMKLQLALKGGLKSSDQGVSERQKRIDRFDAISELIESKVSSQPVNSSDHIE
ncbi:hypothetical protein GGR57DRAFT_464212 [Xylariaceae sp. FL1272]|nr:hypothetical protein GGR57DRAFT_464212 [Xylariaceae sp. FL1272]